MDILIGLSTFIVVSALFGWAVYNSKYTSRTIHQILVEAFSTDHPHEIIGGDGLSAMFDSHHLRLMFGLDWRHAYPERYHVLPVFKDRWPKFSSLEW